MSINFYGQAIFKFFTIKTAHNSKQKSPIPVCLLRVDHGLPRGNHWGKRVEITGKNADISKIGKQNGDTRTRNPEPGYLNLSNIYSIRGRETLSASPLLRSSQVDISQ
jgi:hypothetical protein